VPAPLVLGYRFEPKTVLELIERYQPTFAIGAITAYVSLMNHSHAAEYDLSSLTRVFCGGAPIPPKTVTALEAELGLRIHNAYGLTETTGVTHAMPFGAPPRVDPLSGTLSIGVPYFNTNVRLVDENGYDVAVREMGELVISGPQVARGYWGHASEGAQVFVGDEFYTGDIGFMDEDGWFYLVDRKKDMIIASGFKVWPREIEDVIYEHPAVREVAVIGVEDPYRGETVKAFVGLRPGEQLEPEVLIEFCRKRLAAYKYPREVEIVDELPKSLSGKILRRELRSDRRREIDDVPEQS
jgi:long-chain acyl-CoA synthetase